MDNFGHEAKRFARFEGASVASLNSDGTVDLATGDRPDQRTQALRASGVRLSAGDRALQITAGDADAPVVIGSDPWIS